MAEDGGKITEQLIEHYQQTYEKTYEMWRERNRMFPTLAAVIGGGAMLAFRVPEAESLFVALLGGLFRLDPGLQASLQKSFPFEILQTVIMVVVFHLMLDLYRYTLDISRSYLYLGGLEKEIRERAGFAESSIAFTREDKFYQAHRPAGLAGGIRWVYTLVLGVLLVAFLVARFTDDFQHGATLVTAANAAIALPTLFYYVAYAFPRMGSKPPAKK